MKFELRTDHEERASAVVDTLAEKVLAKTAALSLDQIGQRFQRALVGAGANRLGRRVVDSLP